MANDTVPVTFHYRGSKPLPASAGFGGLYFGENGEIHLSMGDRSADTPFIRMGAEDVDVTELQGQVEKLEGLIG